MKTISKVKSVQGNGSFKSEFGALQDNGDNLLFSFEYQFEDGTVLNANHKTNVSPFPVGSEAEYEVTRESEQYGKGGKVSKPDSYVQQRGNGGKNGYAVESNDSLKGIKIGHAITNAVQIVISDPQIYVGDVKKVKGIRDWAKMILKIGEELINDSEKVKKEPQYIPAHPDTAVLEDGNKDDLPF